MIPNSLRELIRVSRKTAKEFKQAIEDVAELIREKQTEHSLQREPVRVPVRNQNQHPLAGRVIRRQFSTTRNINASVQNFNKNFNKNLNFNKYNTYNKYNKLSNSISNTFKAAIYQNQNPFRLSTKRTQLNFLRNGGIGSGMYTYFPKHNARMFSTFGPNVNRQIIENLSLNLRTFFVKGGETGNNFLTNSNLQNINIGILYSNDSLANNDIKLASKVSEISGLHELGCFVEFDLSTNSVSSLLPESGLFDDDLSIKMEKIYENSIRLQQIVFNDIKLFRNNIGSTSYKFDKKREKLRFYCPNCEIYKMENLLQESGITTGLVKKNLSPQPFNGESSNASSNASLDDPFIISSDSSSYYSRFSNTQSSISTPDLESDIDSVLSSTTSSSNVDMGIGAVVESILSSDSVLSDSDEYFDVSSTAIRI